MTDPRDAVVEAARKTLETLESRFEVHPSSKVHLILRSALAALDETPEQRMSEYSREGLLAVADAARVVVDAGVGGTPFRRAERQDALSKALRRLSETPEQRVVRAAKAWREHPDVSKWFGHPEKLFEDLMAAVDALPETKP